MVGAIQKSAQLLKRLLIGGEPSLASASLRLSAAAAAIAMTGALGGGGAAKSPAPADAGPRQYVWLDQGWTAPQRDRYHHQEQGTATLPIPMSWFLALQQPDLNPRIGLFSDSAYLDRFGFIPSPRDPATNPNGLPVGFAHTTGTDPRTNAPLDAVGFTCAACHTGRFDYRGTTVYVDGGPALIDLAEFGKQLGFALMATLVDTRFERFADRVVGPRNNTPERQRQRDALKARLRIVVHNGLGEMLRSHGGTPEGFGRLDALNRIGNTVFGRAGMGIPGNDVLVTAPVNFPHIWQTSWFAWVQYNGSIRQPMTRNAGEALGVSAPINYNEGPTPRFTSTVPVGSLHDDIEAQLAGNAPFPAQHFSGLTAPAWPQNILPPVDRALAAQGGALYRRHCQGCHLPATNTPEFWASRRWAQIQVDGHPVGDHYLDLAMIPVSHIDTDPAQARDMLNRTVLVPTAYGLTGGTPAGGGNSRYPFAEALKQVVSLAVNRWYDSRNPAVPPAERERLNGNRPNEVRGEVHGEIAYKARPLDGVWATAPYLHNGSVPTLWALLSPYAERNAQPVFALGNRQFDPVRVGYVNGGSTRVDTRVAGNRNTGHLFQTAPDPAHPPAGTIGPTLTPDERRALIEYLKTLPEPADAPAATSYTEPDRRPSVGIIALALGAVLVLLVLAVVVMRRRRPVPGTA